MSDFQIDIITGVRVSQEVHAQMLGAKRDQKRIENPEKLRST